MPKSIIDQYRAARRVGTPLIGIVTSDPASTMAAVVEKTKDGDPWIDPEEEPKEYSEKGGIAVIVHTITDGWQPLNNAGLLAMKQVLGIDSLDADGARDTILERTQDPMQCLVTARDLPFGSLLFILNGHMYLPSERDAAVGFTNALWLLRDRYKQDKRTCVIIGPHFTLPPELKNDVLLMEEPLPDDEELRMVISDVVESAKKGGWLAKGVSEDQLARAVDAARGLPVFATEQITSMAANEQELDLDLLWEHKRTIIEATPGLAVWREGQKFSDIGGIQYAKEFFQKFINGRGRPNCVAWIDEIEQVMAGVAGDTSGTSQDQLQNLLSEMENNKWTGALLFGQPGTAKSALAKAIGNEAGAPTIHFDLGGMKDSLVGGSERRIREAIRVLKAIGGDRVLFIATSNDLNKLPSQFRSRFKLPTFYFDFPDAYTNYKERVERDAIWRIYLESYKLVDFVKDVRALIGFDDMGWSGRNIEQACRLAWQLDLKIWEVAGLVIPESQSAQTEVEGRRKDANGKYLSASSAGKYTIIEPRTEIPTARPKRGPFGEAGNN